MAENLILACYLLFSGCIVVALLNVYWQELVHLPHFVYDCIRGWFKIDTPSEREWSLIKASVISALFIAGYLWWLNTHIAFVSQFPGTLVITVIAIPVAWILWIWRNQDKRETLNNEKVKIEQTEKELGWKEDDRLWNNFFERQKIADDKTIPENVRITAIYALEPYLKLDEKTRFSELTKDFLFNVLQDARRSYQGRLNRFLWGLILIGANVRDEIESTRTRIVTELLYPEGIGSLGHYNEKIILYSEMKMNDGKFMAHDYSSLWLPFSLYNGVTFGGKWARADFFRNNFDDCKFAPEAKFFIGDFIETRFRSMTAIQTTFSGCNFFYATWQESNCFQECTFESTLFVGSFRVFLHDTVNFEKNKFDNCCFINSGDLLTAIIDRGKLNSCSGTKILQFPPEFIQAYEHGMHEQKSDPNATMYQQIWVRYLFSPHTKTVIILDPFTDLCLEYKKQKDEYVKKLHQEPSDSIITLIADANTKDIFDQLFQYNRKRLPYLNELLDMACYFIETKELHWSILDRAYNAKKAELEAESE